MGKLDLKQGDAIDAIGSPFIVLTALENQLFERTTTDHFPSVIASRYGRKYENVSPVDSGVLNMQCHNHQIGMSKRHGFRIMIESDSLPVRTPFHACHCSVLEKLLWARH